MSDNKDLDENILNELKVMNRRLNSIHSWLAVFIIVAIIFFVYVVYYGYMLPH
jgi:hypothetical protein